VGTVGRYFTRYLYVDNVLAAHPPWDAAAEFYEEEVTPVASAASLGTSG
jgi:hypothetical protein